MTLSVYQVYTFVITSLVIVLFSTTIKTICSEWMTTGLTSPTFNIHQMRCLYAPMIIKVQHLHTLRLASNDHNYDIFNEFFSKDAFVKNYRGTNITINGFNLIKCLLATF